MPDSYTSEIISVVNVGVQVNNALWDCKLWCVLSFLPSLAVDECFSAEKTLHHPHSFIPQPGLHSVLLEIIQLVRSQKDVSFDRVSNCQWQLTSESTAAS